MEVWPGGPYPLGATYDGAGTNFALFSEVAESVELCLFDADGSETRVPMTERDALVWHVYLPARHARPALRLPRARALRTRRTATAATRASCCSTRTRRRSRARSTGRRRASPTTFGDPTKRNTDDSGPHTMKSVVINPFFDWQEDRPPRHPYHETVDLRGARQGPDADAPGHPRGDPRHVRRARRTRR